ncbi:MAG: hypothetical protein ACLP36_14230 [Acidimicrobiales bacterium]|jgi:hypothetical protein
MTRKTSTSAATMAALSLAVLTAYAIFFTLLSVKAFTKAAVR